jgi:hypothetical protein
MLDGHSAPGNLALAQLSGQLGSSPCRMRTRDLRPCDWGCSVACAEMVLSLAWRVETAKAAEASFAVPLLDAVKPRGFPPWIAAWPCSIRRSPR